MAAFAGLVAQAGLVEDGLVGAGLVAHGGVGGAIVEAMLTLSIAAIFVALWLRERKK